MSPQSQALVFEQGSGLGVTQLQSSWEAEYILLAPFLQALILCE